MLRKEETNPNQPMEATKSPEVKPWVRWVVAAAASNGFVSQLQPTPIPTSPFRSLATAPSPVGSFARTRGPARRSFA